MRYLLWGIKFLLFALLFVFAMNNAEPVRIRFFLGYSWDAPMALVLLIVLVLGAVLGILASLGQSIRLRREVVQLRKDRKIRQPGPATIPARPDMASTAGEPS
ncbi:lipopolysaccharide assembly protein LapA domain-containing protein [Chitinilyticum piscinae]|uniref:DUF1049 domain-containing protein n=1 Tax=Chitinilyticum piscinae TaxID=2866724 RepID=A0A8J7KAT7_9NEIS|nr:lipopolysaccharide assembly protein LapA domain-containing protein [Chitinilyticum piscinae]MBE9609454.1 DUF1049 domain-containing protein [Chitinilyticum piscinae]